MTVEARMDNELREFQKNLCNKISHERFSFKKLIHIFEYSCVCDGPYYK